MMARGQYIKEYKLQKRQEEGETDCEFVARHIDKYRKNRHLEFGPEGSGFICDFALDIYLELYYVKISTTVLECCTSEIAPPTISLSQ